MNKISKKIKSVLLLIPFFSVVTFCCCLEKDASAENTSIEHRQKLEKSNHPAGHQHQDSKDQDGCSCPEHLSILAEQSFDIILNLSSFQVLAKNFLAAPQFAVVLLSSWSLNSQGPPGQDHRDQVSIPVFLKISNLRI